MQAFLTNNIVNCNLMSLTGFRTLVILGLLIESPKSNDEINEYFFNHQYIKERFSNDTLRIYIHSLRAIGCEITRADKTNNNRYKLVSHPFDYDIPKSQLKALTKLYKSFYDKVDVSQVIDLENLFKKLSTLVNNEHTKISLENISLLKNIDRNILYDLLIHCKKKNQITFLYNSPKSGAKEIEIIADKLSFKSSDKLSDKLYLFGNNLTHKEYSYFAVDRILKICSIKLLKNEEDFPSIKVIYELKIYNNDYKLDTDEKIIQKSEDKLVIEVNSKNEFSLMQRILYMADDCKILQPETFKLKLLDKLKVMEKSYENI